MEARDSFVFYRSFYEAAALLEPEDRLAVMTAICEYALNGKALELSGVAAAIFLLAKPNLDANRRKYENGKKKGKSKSKPDDKQEQTGANEDVNGDEAVNEDGDGAGPGRACSSPAAAVELAYRRQINPMLSASCLRELQGYAERLGEACCLRAIDAALDAGKTSWSYIRAILRDKEAHGVRCIEDWDALEEKRQKPAPAKRLSWAELAREMERKEREGV